ncbi:MAG: putative rane protein [Proteobacteria bacterium]|nr:putative rane protein [Pseudomonadota bacterium]
MSESEDWSDPLGKPAGRGYLPSQTKAGCGLQGWTPWVTGLFILLGAAFGYALIATQKHLISDEGFHAFQVWAIYTGDFSILPNITMIPSYHAVLAAVARVTGVYSDLLSRFVTLAGSLSLPYVAYCMVRRQALLNGGLRVVQLFYFPLLFPLCFLIFTDAWTAAASLATCLLVLRGRGRLAGVAGLLAILLRQDAAVWVGLAWVLLSLEGLELGQGFDWRRALRNGVVRGWPLLAVLLLFCVFVLWNKGVAVGDRKLQSGFNLTNAYMLLFCGWLFFLPQNIVAVPCILQQLLKPRVVLGLLLGFLFYMGTYSNTHQYNGEGMRFWLHNEMLYWPTKYLVVRVLVFIPIAWMVLTFSLTRLAESRFYWFYPVALVSAIAHPLIEPRYYLTSFFLFQLWRPEMDSRWEHAQLLFYLLLAVILIFGTATELFFI